MLFFRKISARVRQCHRSVLYQLAHFTNLRTFLIQLHSSAHSLHYFPFCSDLSSRRIVYRITSLQAHCLSLAREQAELRSTCHHTNMGCQHSKEESVARRLSKANSSRRALWIRDQRDSERTGREPLQFVPRREHPLLATNDLSNSRTVREDCSTHSDT